MKEKNSFLEFSNPIPIVHNTHLPITYTSLYLYTYSLYKYILYKYIHTLNHSRKTYTFAPITPKMTQAEPYSNVHTRIIDTINTTNK